MKPHARTASPIYRAAVRQWLYIKILPVGARTGLATQVLVWLGLLLFFVWGLVGLIASPLQ